jgi:hypothetical protein
MGAVAREMYYSNDGEDPKAKIARIAGITALTYLGTTLIDQVSTLFQSPDVTTVAALTAPATQTTEAQAAAGEPQVAEQVQEPLPRSPNVRLKLAGGLLAIGTAGGISMILLNKENHGKWMVPLAASTSLINNGFRMFDVCRRVDKGVSWGEGVPLAFTFAGAAIPWGTTVGHHTSRVLEQRALATESLVSLP